MNSKINKISKLGVLLGLTMVIAPIYIPTQPVPQTMQMLMLFLVSMTLPFAEATTVIGLYVFLGAMGLPVFAGYSGGLAPFLGPTGGYIWAFPTIPLFFWLFSKTKLSKSVARAFSVFTSFTFVCFVGTTWLYIFLNQGKVMSPITFKIIYQWLLIGYVPFIPLCMIIWGIIASKISDRVNKIIN